MRRGRPPYPDLLTPREQQVIKQLRRGLTNKQIARELNISESGARYHVSEILSKLGVSSRQEAALWRPEPDGRFAMFGWLVGLRRFSRFRVGLRIVALGGLIAVAAGLILLAAGVTINANRDHASRASATPTLDACPANPPVSPSPLATGDDTWSMARELMPADVEVYEPTGLSASMGSPILLQACLDTNDVPQYTVLYHSGQTYLVLIMNLSTAGAWGNTPGPPSTTKPVSVHGFDGILTYVSEHSNGVWSELYTVGWSENGVNYQVKLGNTDESAQVSQSDVVRLVDGLQAVRTPR